MRCPFEGLDDCAYNYEKTVYGMSIKSLARHLCEEHPSRIHSPVIFAVYVEEKDGFPRIYIELLDNDLKEIARMRDGWAPGEKITYRKLGETKDE